MFRFFHTSIFSSSTPNSCFVSGAEPAAAPARTPAPPGPGRPGHDAKAMAPVPVQYPDKIHVRPAVVHARDHLQRCHRILCAP